MDAPAVTGQSSGDVGHVVPRWINQRRAQLTVYYRYVAEEYNPEGSGVMPDVCSHPWSAAWRWISPDGVERHWVSAAPASDIVPTRDGFLVLANRLHDCRRTRAPGLTPGDSPWWFVDARGEIHRLGWVPVPRHRDAAVGAVPCQRDVYPSRYCSFDRRTLTLSPLDFVPRGTTPIRLDPDGRVWVGLPPGGEPLPSGVVLAWSDDQGKTWDGWVPPTSEGSGAECAVGGATVICNLVDSLSISTDRARTWSTKATSAWLNDASLPRRYQRRTLELYQQHVTRSGAIVGLVDDNGESRYSVVRRGPGRDASFELAAVPDATRLPDSLETVVDAAGMLVLGYLAGQVHDYDRADARPAPIFVSDDDGASWARFAAQH